MKLKNNANFTEVIFEERKRKSTSLKTMSAVVEGMQYSILAKIYDVVCKSQP